MKLKELIRELNALPEYYSDVEVKMWADGSKPISIDGVGAVKDLVRRSRPFGFPHFIGLCHNKPEPSANLNQSQGEVNE